MMLLTRTRRAASFVRALLLSGTRHMSKNQENSKRFWKVAEIAADLGVRRAAVYQEIRAGRLAAFHIGKRILVPADAYQAFTHGGAAQSTSVVARAR